MSIGLKIKEIREAKSIKESAINKAVGQPADWIQSIESGTDDITAKDLKAVADLLDVPIQMFFSPITYRVNKTLEQRVTERILKFSHSVKMDLNELNAEIGQPVGWLQQLPKEVSVEQLAKVSNYLGYPVDLFAVGL